jgi:GT2 family glycosyltransferase
LRVVACIAHYADLDATAAAIASLAAGALVPDLLCLVDNQGDVDSGAEERLRTAAGGMALEVVRPGRNIGFAGAGAEGARRARDAGADWLLIVNNDAELHDDCLVALLAAGDDFPRAALLGPVVHYRDDGAPWFAGGFVDWRHLAIRQEQRVLDKEPYRCDFVSGCVLLARLRAVEESGPLDADLFMYLEDVEWAWRLLGRGWTALVVPSAHARHTVARRGRRRLHSPATIYFIMRNWLRLGRLVGHPAESAPTALWWALKQVVKSRSTTEVATSVTAIICGLRDGMHGRGGPLPVSVAAALERASTLGAGRRVAR